MAEPSVEKPRATRGSLWWYGPIIAVLALGYAAGGALSFGTAFLRWFPIVSDPAGRVTMQLFGMGMLGSCLYCSRWWSLDYEAAQTDPSIRPTALDWFGYATTLIGAGIAGVVLCLLLRYGVGVLTDTKALALRPGASLVIALTGGFYYFDVLALLRELFTKIRGRVTGASENEKKPTDPTGSL